MNAVSFRTSESENTLENKVNVENVETINKHFNNIINDIIVKAMMLLNILRSNSKSKSRRRITTTTTRIIMIIIISTPLIKTNTIMTVS